MYCIKRHEQPCQDCLGMVNVASTIVREGFWKMKDAFRCLALHKQPCPAYPKMVQFNADLTGCKPVKRTDSVKMKNYTSPHAKRKFLQMPIAALHIKNGMESPYS